MKVQYVNLIVPGLGTLLTGNDELRACAVVNILLVVIGLLLINKGNKCKCKNKVWGGLALIGFAWLRSLNSTKKLENFVVGKCTLETSGGHDFSLSCESTPRNPYGPNPSEEPVVVNKESFGSNQWEDDLECNVNRAKNGGIYPSLEKSGLWLPPTHGGYQWVK